MRTHNDIIAMSAFMRETDEVKTGQGTATLQPPLQPEHWQRHFILLDDLYTGVSSLTASFQSFKVLQNVPLTLWKHETL